MSISPTQPERFDAARGGDAEAFDELFADAADRVLILARVRLGPTVAARLDERDVLQEVYLRARGSIADFRGTDRRSFVAWLCAIASHVVASEARAAGRVSSGPGPSIARVLELSVDPHTGPITAAARTDARARLADAIADLPDADRDVLVAHFFEGRSLADVARTTGASSSAVQRALARALVAVGGPLRRALGEEAAR